MRKKPLDAGGLECVTVQKDESSNVASAEINADGVELKYVREDGTK